MLSQQHSFCWTKGISKRTKNAAISFFRFYDRSTIRALPKILTGIGWHFFGGLMATFRAGYSRLKGDYIHNYPNVVIAKMESPITLIKIKSHTIKVLILPPPSIFIIFME